MMTGPKPNLLRIQPAFALGIPGAALLLLARVGIVPAAWIAAIASDDGLISDQLASRLSSGQFTLGLLMLAGGILLWKPPQLLNRLIRGASDMSDRAFLGLLLPSTFLLCLYIQAAWFQNIPHVTDATSHWFQAQLLADGHLFGKAPSCFEHFWQHNTVLSQDGKWFTKYPLGTACWFALGFRVNMPWLPGPLALLLSVFALYRIALVFLTRNQARAVAVLFALSPMSLLLGGSYMSHTPFTMLALGGTALFLAGINAATKNRILLLTAGFLLGWTPLTRPPEAVLLICFYVLAWLLVPADRKRSVFTGALWMLPGYLLPISWSLYTNHVLYGSLLAVGYGVTNVASPVPVIRVHFGFSEAFPLGKALQHLIWVISKASLALFGWPTSFLFVPLALAARPYRRIVTWALGAMLLTIGFFFCYSYPGFEYEGRFHYLLMPPLLALTAIGLQWIINRAGGPAAAVLIFVLAGFALLYTWPRVLAPQYAHDYEQACADIADAAHDTLPENSIVLVDSTGMQEFRFSSLFPFNDPGLEKGILFGRFLGDDLTCLETAYPNRPIYRFIPGTRPCSGTFSRLNAGL